MSNNQNEAAKALNRAMLEAFAFGSAADQRAEAATKVSREEIAQIKAQGGTYYHDASAVEETRARREAQKAAQIEANATGIDVQIGRVRSGEWVAPHRVVDVPAEEKARLQNSILNTSKGGGAAASINVGKHGAVQTSVGATGGTQWLDFDEG